MKTYIRPIDKIESFLVTTDFLRKGYVVNLSILDGLERDKDYDNLKNYTISNIIRLFVFFMRRGTPNRIFVELVYDPYQIDGSVYQKYLSVRYSYRSDFWIKEHQKHAVVFPNYDTFKNSNRCLI